MEKVGVKFCESCKEKKRERVQRRKEKKKKKERKRKFVGNHKWVRKNNPLFSFYKGISWVYL